MILNCSWWHGEGESIRERMCANHTKWTEIQSTQFMDKIVRRIKQDKSELRPRNVLLLGDSLTKWRYVMSQCISTYYGLARWITFAHKGWMKAWGDNGVNMHEELKRYDLVFANQGAHYNTVVDYRRFLAIAEKELLRLPAVTRRKFIWVESTAQHYTGGTYNASRPPTSCEDLDSKGIHVALWRDVEAVPVMSKAGIQIVPDVMNTLSAWDDHPSLRRDGKLDCTHFCSNGRTVKRQVEQMLDTISALLF
eukprot:TRINITY_DN9957_c0_g1_i6.p2 TRINITY_DN9957_c0_g1~~TRINITY_DN9957_c0_g1_i6.p2  ORF type:complete len:251 (-),score=16.37 TRINITY_DN9957_c0_g1_i6:489-1241(-)